MTNKEIIKYMTDELLEAHELNNAYMDQIDILLHKLRKKTKALKRLKWTLRVLRRGE